MEQQNLLENDLLFEISWEVCNKVGGIYTVLSTKANSLEQLFKDNLIFIGPDLWSNQNKSPYFIEDNSVLKDWTERDKLPYGISVRVGRWNIPSYPVVILVKYDGVYEIKNDLYAKMWDNFKVDSLHAYGDYDDSCMFAIASAIVIENILKSGIFSKCKNVIAHFDEWTVGMGLLYTRMFMPQVATVFTTHATSIGRSICSNNKPLYDYMSGYNGDQMAEELNMQSKHSLEKAAAHNADAFTTVSDVTAAECRQLLEIYPSVVTPNGFDGNFVPKGKNYTQARTLARKTLLKVASAVCAEKIESNAFLIATSGRNEFRNKGLDAFLDMVNRLRDNENKLTRQVVAFVMVPSWISGPNESLQKALRDNKLLSPGSQPVTHNLVNGFYDSILGKINNLCLQNTLGSKVKIIYVPSYLNGSDGIFNMAYYDLLPGFDSTAFPSYYEPWGYTPLESIAFGVPTVTTNLSGFGQWILVNFNNEVEKCGVKVIERTDSTYSQVVESLADYMLKLSSYSPQKLSAIRKHAVETAQKASWNIFVNYYIKAYEIAISKATCRKH